MKDYSKYFKGPSLKDAKHRGKDEVHHIDDAYEVPADMIGIGKGQKYFIQTYGCQANERDGETLAGILESLGYEATDEIKDAQVVLLNTCTEFVAAIHNINPCFIRMGTMTRQIFNNIAFFRPDF